MSALRPLAPRTSPHFWRKRPGVTNRGDGLAVAGYRHGFVRPGFQGLIAFPERFGDPVSRIQGGEGRAAVDSFSEKNSSVCLPGEPCGRTFAGRRQVLCGTSCSRHGIDIAARGTLITHDPADVPDLFAIGRPARVRDLQCGFVDEAVLSSGQRHCVKPGDPPVVITITLGCRVGETVAVRRPIIFIDIRIGRGHGLRDSCPGINNIDPLFENPFFHQTRVLCGGFQRPGCARRVFSEQNRQARTIGRPAGTGEKAGKPGDSARRDRTGDGLDIKLKLPGFPRVRQERKLTAVGRKSEAVFRVGDPGRRQLTRNCAGFGEVQQPDFRIAGFRRVGIAQIDGPAEPLAIRRDDRFLVLGGTRDGGSELRYGLGSGAGGQREQYEDTAR
ncbi:MAG: hypothetical protein QOJ99_5916 [Bryobacterales bacterium]|nr:hypothetical protein [Bryobacterales bacterium]